MKSISSYSLVGGSSILIEVVEPEDRGIAPVARGDGVSEKVTMSFEEELDKIRPVADTIIAKFRDLTCKPDEVQIEFGLKMSASAGAIITSGTVEANFNVTLKWSMEKSHGSTT